MCTFLKQKKTRTINCVSAGIKTSKCLLSAYQEKKSCQAHRKYLHCVLSSKFAFCGKHKAEHKSRPRISCSNHCDPQTLSLLQLFWLVFWGKWDGCRGWSHAFPLYIFRSRKNTPHSLLYVMLCKARKATYFSSKIKWQGTILQQICWDEFNCYGALLMKDQNITVWLPACNWESRGKIKNVLLF